MMSRRTHQLLRVLALVALASGRGTTSTAVADFVVYQTNFDHPEFDAGPLGGQGGWLTPFGPPDATQVVANTPGVGGQFARFDDSAISGPPILVASRPLYYDPVAAGFSRVSARLDVALEAATSNSSFEYQITSVGDRPLLFGGMVVLADGTVQAFNTDGDFFSTAPGAAPPGSFSTLRLDLDFLARRTTYYLNGVSLGSLAFDRDASNTLRDVTILTVLDPLFTTPSRDRWDFDNLSVTATVPEPRSLTLALLGSAAFGLVRLRPRRDSVGRPR